MRRGAQLTPIGMPTVCCIKVWRHHFKYAKVVITNWSTVTIYPFLKWQWILFLFICFSFLCPLSLTRLLSDLTMNNIPGVLLEKEASYPSRGREITPVLFLLLICMEFFVCVGGSLLIIILVFCYVFVLSSFCVLYVMVHVSLTCPFLIAPLVISKCEWY